MNDVRFAQSFKKLVEVNGNVQPRETVVIVTDYSMTDIARQLAVAAAMKEADVIFSPVRFSITHTIAMKEALKNKLYFLGI